jgi:cysteinyl-tRNA synthetase
MSEADILAVIDARSAAKLAKDFAQADAIRKQLLDAGIVLKDGAGQTSWEVVQ